MYHSNRVNPRRQAITFMDDSMGAPCDVGPQPGSHNIQQWHFKPRGFSAPLPVFAILPVKVPIDVKLYRKCGFHVPGIPVCRDTAASGITMEEDRNLLKAWKGRSCGYKVLVDAAEGSNQMQSDHIRMLTTVNRC